MDGDIRWWKPTRQVVNVACKQKGAGLFSENVGGVETGGNVLESNKIAFNPVQKSIVIDLDMTRLLGGLSGISHEDGATVVFIKYSSKLLK
jgi:hypothetical protein